MLLILVLSIGLIAGCTDGPSDYWEGSALLDTSFPDDTSVPLDTSDTADTEGATDEESCGEEDTEIGDCTPDSDTNTDAATDTETEEEIDTESDSSTNDSFCSSATYINFINSQPFPFFNTLAPSIGNPVNPDVFIAGYSYFGCGHCKNWAQSVEELFSDSEIQDRVVYYFRHYPFSFSGTNWDGHRAAYAAHIQGQFWPMHDKIFENMGNYTESDIFTWAEEMGLDMEKFDTDFNSQLTYDFLYDEKTYARESYGVTGTPKVFIEGRLISSRATVPDIVRCLLAE